MKQGWIENEDGTKRHYVNDKIHSINDEPSFIYLDGTKACTKGWLKEGMLHRELGPAWICGYFNKDEYWFEDKQYPEITSDLEWLMKVEELKRR